MTNGWIDIKNTDMMLIMGGNPAENHPCGFKWPIEAKLTRNAKMIVVDPRFTRTAATADLFLQIRAGTDIAFLGGLINYAIRNNRIAKDYLVNYTNAAFIVKEGFKLPEDGLFSGFDPDAQMYDKATWNYEAGGKIGPASHRTRTMDGDSDPGASPESKRKNQHDSAAQAAGNQPSPTGGGHGTPSGTAGEGQGHQAFGQMGAKAKEGTPPPMLPAERRLRSFAAASALVSSSS